MKQSIDEILENASQSINQKLEPQQEREYSERMRTVIRGSQAGKSLSKKTWDYHLVGGRKLYWIFSGCPWFEQSGCSMCDGYGQSPQLVPGNPDYQASMNQTIDEVLQDIAHDAEAVFDSGKRYFLANAGSATTFDNRSLPEEARIRLFQGINKILKPFVENGGMAFYLFETRLNNITEKKLQELRKYVDERINVVIGVGVEAASDLVREVYLNKGLGKDVIGKLKEKVELAKRYNVGLEGHSILGIPGLTEAESIASAVETTEQIIDAGARAVLMTTNLKEAPCLASRMNQRGEFHVPSIHATAEALRILNERGYGDVIPAGWGVVDPAYEFAKGCDQCTDRLISVFDQYAHHVMFEGSEAAMNYFASADIDCGSCKPDWVDRLSRECSNKPVAERLPEYIARQEQHL